MRWAPRPAIGNSIIIIISNNIIIISMTISMTIIIIIISMIIIIISSSIIHVNIHSKYLKKKAVGASTGSRQLPRREDAWEAACSIV